VVEKLKTKITVDVSTAEAQNLTSKFDDADLQTLGSWILKGYAADLQSRAKWEKRMDAAMDLAMQVVKEKTFPWPGASNVVFPLVTIAALQFSARSLTNLIQGDNVFRYKAYGMQSDPDAKGKSLLMGQFLSWQVLEQDTEWEPQHDRLFIYTSIVGTGFVKSSHDPDLEYPIDRFVTARDLVVDYNAESVESAQRKSHVVPIARNKIHARIERKIYRDCNKEPWYLDVPKVSSNLPTPSSTPSINNRVGTLPEASPDFLTPFRCIEQHVNLDLDQDGYYEPYIVTVESNTGYVLRIVARWDSEGDVERNNDTIISIKAHEYFTAYGFIPNPESPIYSLGFGTLLGPLNEAVSSGINQILDAGTMANSNGGFLARGVKIRGGVLTIAPWEWKRVDSTGDDLRKSMVPLPINSPSTVMFQLLGLIIQYADRISGSQEVMVGENPGQNTPAETSRNMVEQGMQVYAAIFKRFWRALKQEGKKRHVLNGKYLPKKAVFGKGSEVMRDWFRVNPDLVAPIANPNVTSKAQRIQKASMVRQAAQTIAGYDVDYTERLWLAAMDVDDIDQVYPGMEKTGPKANPKIELEKMKLQGVKMKLDHEKEEFAHEMMEQQKLNNATIANLEAQAIATMQGVKNDASALQIQAFDSIINGLKTQNEMIDSRLQSVQGGKDDNSPTDSSGGSETQGSPGEASSGA
jgi:chaperonin GroES